MITITWDDTEAKYDEGFTKTQIIKSSSVSGTEISLPNAIDHATDSRGHRFDNKFKITYLKSNRNEVIDANNITDLTVSEDIKISPVFKEESGNIITVRFTNNNGVSYAPGFNATQSLTETRYGAQVTLADLTFPTLENVVLPEGYNWDGETINIPGFGSEVKISVIKSQPDNYKVGLDTIVNLVLTVTEESHS